jgi:hypothetical protein
VRIDAVARHGLENRIQRGRQLPAPDRAAAVETLPSQDGIAKVALGFVMPRAGLCRVSGARSISIAHLGLGTVANAA